MITKADLREVDLEALAQGIMWCRSQEDIDWLVGRLTDLSAEKVRSDRGRPMWPEGKTTVDHLDTMGGFWRANRKLQREKDPDRHADLRRNLSGAMVAWARGFKAPDRLVPTSVDEAVVLTMVQVIRACEAARRHPGWEVFCKPPDDPYEGDVGWWMISWSAGPVDWAISPLDVVSAHCRQGHHWKAQVVTPTCLKFFSPAVEP